MENNESADHIEDSSDKESINVPKSEDKPTSDKAENKTEHSPKSEENTLGVIRAAEHRMIWLTAAMAFFAFCGVVVGILQWITSSGQKSTMDETLKAIFTQTKAMQGQLEQMKGSSAQTEKLIAEAGKQSTAAQNIARVSQDALKLSRDNFIEDQRPFMFLIDARLEFTDEKPQTLSSGKPVVWRIMYWNYGRSPAIRFGMLGRAFTGPNAKTQAYDYMSAMPIDLHEIAGGGSGDSSIVPPSNGSPDVKTTPYSSVVSASFPTPADLIYATTREFGLFAVGRLYYADTHGNFYYTDFCRFRLLTGAIATCDKYNETHTYKSNRPVTP